MAENFRLNLSTLDDPEDVDLFVTCCYRVRTELEDRFLRERGEWDG